MILTKLDEAVEEFHHTYMLKNRDCFENCPFHKNNFSDNQFRCSIHYVKEHKNEVEEIYNSINNKREAVE